MAELHIKGYLCNDYNYIIGISDDKQEDDEPLWFGNKADSIIDTIESFAMEYGLYGKHHKGLGGRQSYIENCNLRIYFTDAKCELEDAMMAMDSIMYGGTIKTKVNYCGYSEYTITGLDLEEFTIGGHDLESELRSHFGEYMHMIIEC